MITKKRKGNTLILEILEGSLTVACLYAAYTTWDRNRMIVSTLKTEKEWRGNGYASKLLRRAILEARRNRCKVIELEDCSDYYGLPNNIYIKHGFKYTDNDSTMEIVL